MNALIRLAVTAAVGAAGMYWLDPQSGRRRRALARDKLASSASHLSEGARIGARDLSYRARGAGAKVRSRFSHKVVTDDVLAARVRAALGRAVSHSGAIDVLVGGGRVTLVGDILASEHEALLSTVRRVPGVMDVEDHLGVHERADGVSALQGGIPRNARPFELWHEHWRPATRLLAGVSGAGLLLIGGSQFAGRHAHPLLGFSALALGGALVARSASNAPLRQLVGGGGRAIEIRKTMFVQAPVEKVFAALADYENYPSFMRNVRSVRMFSDVRSHWEVAGPGGVSVEWESETTAFKPNELLAWRSVAHSAVTHAGIIRFSHARDGTRLDIQMTYSPPGGALGHLVAKLSGADPKKELDEDLLRLKSFLESGVPPRDAARTRAGAAASAHQASAPQASTHPAGMD
jgi:uncharacterized membrane protein